MKNNQIIFNVTDGKAKITMRKPLSFEDFLQVIQTGILSAMHSIVTSAENKEEATAVLYDTYNLACSRTLEAFAPEYEMRPHLTTEAIYRMENKILNEVARDGKRKKKPTQRKLPQTKTE